MSPYNLFLKVVKGVSLSHKQPNLFLTKYSSTVRCLISTTSFDSISSYLVKVSVVEPVVQVGKL